MTEKSSQFTVFYAWQSDTPDKANRYLIRDAAKEAVEALELDSSAELVLSPRLDHDTKDVPGSPNIVTTIFEKIARCDAFLADLSYVGKSTVGAGKLLPNPNVLIELGYAFGTVGPDRVVCVMNTAFGKPNELPFDLIQRRWPITYELDGSEKPPKGLRDKLTKEIQGALHLILKEAPPLGAGAATAPTPDVRVEVSAGYATPGFEPIICVDIQNHSPDQVFFGQLRFELRDKGHAVPTVDRMRHMLKDRQQPRIIAPGDSYSLSFSATEYIEVLDQIVAVSVTDRVNRVYSAKPEAVRTTFANLKNALARKADRR